MQTRLKLFVVQVLFAALLMGCTSPGSLTITAATGRTDKRWADEAETIGVAESDIAEVVHIATERYQLVVIRVQKADGGGIAVYLADKPDRPHGIVVVFRKVDGRWQEDPKSKDEWIV
jgi:hypothetical protein